ncbi:sensor histidine kinase [Aquimarina sp. MMG016]|uniref:sensor histidine kinase n=1 Tax=Aquimarina sp. MMG016 TaxID=2822690 RepID=UPI001B3A0F45|nr:sensor histidine kinase [Aquimarina sp. MMG016]MBQ4822724.1 sensor histidine kinase [Aquimarina sp. MMG016]
MSNRILKSDTYQIPVRYHFIFWTGYFLINFIRWGSYFDDYVYSLKSNIVEFSLHIIITYFHIYYLIPRLVLKKKIALYFVAIIGTLALVYVARTWLNLLLVTSNIWPEAIGNQKAFSFNHIVAVTIGEIYVVALVTAIKLTIDWIAERKKNASLKQLQLQTELKYLKSQIQPHFFFNTLNSLYYLTMEKSEKAPDVVLKLSEIMQYVLYDVKEPQIGLLNEINYIQSYLELERLRHGEKVTSEIQIKGNIDDIVIPPLLLLPFIENCFKHGSKNNDSVALDIHFENAKDEELIFTAKNNFNTNNTNEKKHGIGIENVRRRLELLYKNNYSLETKIIDNTFNVLLKIPLL